VKGKRKRKGFTVVLGEGDEKGESVRCVSEVGGALFI